MKKVFKKISLGNVSDTLSDSQLKKVLGGKKVLGFIYCSYLYDGIYHEGACAGSSVSDCESDCNRHYGSIDGGCACWYE